MLNQLVALEQNLLTTSTRKNRARLEGLLAEDFFEFGSSGTVWTRGEILEKLPEEMPTPVAASNFKTYELAEGIALVTYRTERTESDGSVFAAIRSSIWRLRGADWQMFFHQGTMI